MTRKLFRRAVHSAIFLLVAAACVTAVLAIYCEWIVRSFYDGAERVDGVIVAVNQQRGEYAPVIEFVDKSGVKHEAKFTPFIETTPEMVGQIRPVLYNPNHPIRHAIESPWIWIGPLIYGVATSVLIAIAGAFYIFERRTWSPQMALSHGA